MATPLLIELAAWLYMRPLDALYCQSSSRNVTVTTAAPIPNSSEPPNPSHDFFGLIAGTIRCRPNSTPAT